MIQRTSRRTFLLGAVLLTVSLAPLSAWADEAVPAEPPLRWWKGNIHTHSLWSDGDDFPEMIADWYKQHGYQFLALTDHNIIAEGEKWIDAEANATRREAVRKYETRFGSRWPEYRTVRDRKDDKKQVRLKPIAEFRSLLEEPGKFLLVPAEEITHSYAKRPIHMNGINLRDTVKPIDGKDALAAAIAANRRDFDARFELAQTHFAAGRFTEAMDELLEIVMRDKAWNGELARKTYVAILELMSKPAPKAAAVETQKGALEVTGKAAAAPADPVVDQYRRKLSMALF